MVIIKHAPLPPAQPIIPGFSTSAAVQIMKAEAKQKARDRAQDWGMG